jgi:hypothetical protein
MPVTPSSAQRAQNWLMGNFGDRIRAASIPPVDPELICAIACKETACIWLNWIDKIPPAEVLAHCVFDASGDFPNTSRSAFPVNAAAFRERFPQLCDELIDEANQMRKLRGWGPEKWLYKGYGIFQYDLQNIVTDPDFFQKKLWRDFDACLDRLLRELRDKLQAAGGNLRDAVRRYNGSGPKAEQYADHVMLIRDWLKAMA